MLTKQPEKPQKSLNASSAKADTTPTANLVSSLLPSATIPDISMLLPLALSGLADPQSFGWNPTELKENGSISNSHEVEQAQTESSRPIVCTVCSKTFTTYSNLRQHSQIHENKEKRSFYTCNVCNKSYLYKCSLNKHMKRHSSAKQPARDNDAVTTSSASSDNSENNLEPATSKKVKVEEKQETPSASKTLEEKLKDFLENNKNNATPAIAQGFSFFLSQNITGGSTQKLKITVEPVGNENETQEPPVSLEQKLLEQMLPPKNFASHLFGNSYSLLEKLLKQPLNPNPYADFGFQVQNGLAGLKNNLFF